MPNKIFEFFETAKGHDIKVIIVGTARSAYLFGMVALKKTELPVLDVLVKCFR